MRLFRVDRCPQRRDPTAIPPFQQQPGSRRSWLGKRPRHRARPKNGADVVVRIRVCRCSLLSEDGRPFDLLSEASHLAEEETASMPVRMKDRNTNPVPGRLCVYRHDSDSVEIARRKMRRSTSRKQRKLTRDALEGAKYVALFTTVNEQELPLPVVFDLYRYRWQIELTFKRLKSLTGFGHLPKHDDKSCRAWLYGKLLVGLLAETMARKPFPP